MATSNDWFPIKNSEILFTLILDNIGVEGAEVEELTTLDDMLLEKLKPVHGLILLSKSFQDDEVLPVLTDKETLDKIYFARQVVTNACPTQALVTVAINCQHPDVNIDYDIKKLKDSSMSSDPEMRGIALSTARGIRTEHNSMALKEYANPLTAPKEAYAYHYVVYMPINGRLYALDGLREGPIDHGPIVGDWLQTVRPIIINKINMLHTGGEADFNLMAVITEKKLHLERKLFNLHCGPSLHTLSAHDFEKKSSKITKLTRQENIKKHRYKEYVKRNCIGGTEGRKTDDMFGNTYPDISELCLHKK